MFLGNGINYDCPPTVPVFVRREGEPKATHVQPTHPRVGQPVKGAATQPPALHDSFLFQSQDGRPRGRFADIPDGHRPDQTAKPASPPAWQYVLSIQGKNGRIRMYLGAQSFTLFRVASLYLKARQVTHGRYNIAAYCTPKYSLCQIGKAGESVQ